MSSDRWEIPADRYQEGIDVEPIKVTTLHVERLNMHGESYIATYSGVRTYLVKDRVLFIETYDADHIINADRWIDVTAYTHNDFG